MNKKHWLIHMVLEGMSLQRYSLLAGKYQESIPRDVHLRLHHVQPGSNILPPYIRKRQAPESFSRYRHYLWAGDEHRVFSTHQRPVQVPDVGSSWDSSVVDVEFSVPRSSVDQGTSLTSSSAGDKAFGEIVAIQTTSVRAYNELPK